MVSGARAAVNSAPYHGGMTQSEPTVFERIVARELPARIVFENERIISFHDINPRTPVHLLIVPKTPAYKNVVELAAADPALLAEMVAVAQQLADEHCGGHFRMGFNTGVNAGQTVFHVHAHLFGGFLTEESLGKQ